MVYSQCCPLVVPLLYYQLNLLSLKKRELKMKFRIIYTLPFVLLAIMTVYIMVFNTVKYFEVVFIFYAITILARTKLLRFFEKNRLILFIVAEFLLIVFTATTSLAMLLWEEEKLPVLLIVNSVVLLLEIGYSLKEYPYRFKSKSLN